jgi:hypothetical protein
LLNTILVEATFKANRSTVANNRTLGKDEKSSGRWVLTATIRTKRDTIMFEIKNVSSKKDGSGKIIIAINVKMPNGNATERPKLAELNPVAVLFNVCINSSFMALHVAGKFRATIKI